VIGDEDEEEEIGVAEDIHRNWKKKKSCIPARRERTCV